MKLFKDADGLDRFSTMLTGLVSVAGLALTSASGAGAAVAIAGISSGLLGLACTGRSSLLGRRALRESSAPAVIDRLARDLQRHGDSWLRGTNGDADDLDAAVHTFRHYFDAVRPERLPIPSDLVEAGLDGPALARAMLERAADAAPMDFDPGRADTRVNRDVFLRVLEGAFRELLKQSSFVISLQPAFMQLVLEELRKTGAQGEQILEAIATLRARLDAHDAACLSTGLKRYPIGELAPSALLDPGFAIVPFVPIGTALADMLGWCHDPEGPDVAVQLIWGGGGRGKTRLLIEVARRLREEADGTETWMAGLLKPDMTTRALTELFARHRWVFLGIDRAEVRPEQVATALATARNAGEGCRVRVVLTARTAGDWWERDLRTSDDDVGHLLRAPATRAWELEPLASEISSREVLFAAARESFEDRVSRADEQEPSVTRPDVALDASHLGDPLLLVMAALTSVLGRQATTERALFDAVLDSERGYWSRGMKQMGAAGDSLVLENAATVITLMQGTRTPASSHDAVSRVLADVGRDQSTTDALVRTLHRFYGRPEPGTLRPVAPDRLGEYLVMVSLARRPSLLELVLDPDVEMAQGPHTQRSVLTVLTRLAKWRREEGEGLLVAALSPRFDRLILPAIAVGRETGDPIGRIAADLLERSGDATTATIIVDQIPRHSIALSELGAVATRLAADEATVSPDASVEQRADHAGYLNDLSNRLERTGQAQKALEYIKHAVQIHRKLHLDGWVHARSALAQSLANLSNRLQALEQFESALVKVDEAIMIEQQLDTEQPGSRRATLAAAFGNRSTALGGLDRHGDALDAVRSAERLMRELVQEDFTTYAPRLAGILGNLSQGLSHMQSPDDALKAAEESRELFSRLANEEPDAYRPDYALSLINLSICLSAMHRFDAAHGASAESVSILRDLACHRFAAYGPDLAKALAVHSGYLLATGRIEPARAAANEAVDQYRALARANPLAYRRLLAAALGTLGRVLSETSRRGEAEAPVEESIELFRDLYEEQPDAFRSSLSNALQNRAALLDEPDRQPERLEAFEEIVAMRRELVERHPGSFEVQLAVALGNVAGVHIGLGRAAQAFAPAQESADLLRELHARNRAFGPSLADALNLLARVLGMAGELTLAFDTAGEAVTLNRALAAEQPEAIRAALSDSLTTQADILRHSGYAEPALVAIDESIAYRRMLVAEGQVRITQKLASALTVRAECLFRLGRRDAAIEAMEEAATLFGELAVEDSATFAQAIAMIEVDLERIRQS